MLARSDATVSRTSSKARQENREILVVASKLKNYIRERSDMNTSDAVMDALSDALRTLCDEAIERAREAGRKTVMDRDFRKI